MPKASSLRRISASASFNRPDIMKKLIRSAISSSSAGHGGSTSSNARASSRRARPFSAMPSSMRKTPTRISTTAR